ncbi:MAG TPA: TetR/AcrR family transcriptional regulator [Albidovulum sp.]|uniref:TetR/AcrR family transcriptional regulator n=1 Tax=Albidovulum sp. TaxID=1872424 RepID=UPI002C2E3542|nr:TetR/AcrR family transcriptional regulator [Albidovulum sp.]
MSEESEIGHGWRGSAEVWIEAAYTLLIEGGVEAVKILPLAKGLRLSRTSFYWHFADREALLAALIRRWEEKNTGNLVRQTELPAPSVNAAALNLIDCWITPELFDSQLDRAMRDWARTDSALRAAFAEADTTRLAAIRAMYLRHGYGPEEADVRANAVYLTQVGYIDLDTRETLETRLRRVPTYVEIFTGQKVSPADLAGFLGRHTGREG